jgi:hypothetical protein
MTGLSSAGNPAGCPEGRLAPGAVSETRRSTAAGWRHYPDPDERKIAEDHDGGSDL